MSSWPSLFQFFPVVTVHIHLQPLFAFYRSPSCAAVLCRTQAETLGFADFRLMSLNRNFTQDHSPMVYMLVTKPFGGHLLNHW